MLGMSKEEYRESGYRVVELTVEYIRKYFDTIDIPFITITLETDFLFIFFSSSSTNLRRKL